MTEAPPTAGLEPPPEPQPPVHMQLPALPRHFVGRDEVTRDLAATLLERRLVSVVGPGGLGKTTLAVAVAWRLSATMTGGICFLDLARLRDSAVLEAELGLALGMDGASGVSRDGLRQRLAGQRLLLVLDCCETVIGAAAELAEDLSAAVPELLILATSREPLRAEGEWVHRLAPLASPPESAALPAWLAMTYSAVQLFFDVAQSRDASFTQTADNLAQATALCSRLDGSPLGITLVASHANRVGMPGIAAQLGPELLSLGADGQTGRHRSLEAVLDWSYRLLQGREQRIFQALSTLRGSFDLETAVRVAGGPRAEAMDGVLDLNDKSLLMTLQLGDKALFRLPDVTRAYAGTQLERADAEEYRAARTRHAQALMQLLAEAEQQWNSMERADWRRCYGVWIEDVRHALGWAFSDTGDALLGAELTVAVLQLAAQSGLVAGFADFAGRALHEVERLDPPRPDLAMRLRVFPAFGFLRLTDHESRHLTGRAKATDIHTLPGSATAKLGPLIVLWSHSFQVGNYHAALQYSADIQRLSASDWVMDFTSRRTRAQTLHFLGDHAGARALATGVLAQAGRRVPLAYTPSPVSPEVSMRVVLARVHWLQGQADQAWRTVEDCVAIAEQDAPPSICQALAIAAIPVALWCGRKDACAVWAAQLLEQASRYEFPYYIAWAHVIENVLGVGAAHQPARLEALKTLASDDQTKCRDHLSTFEPDDLSLDSFMRVQTGAVGWCAPEILRVKAEHIAAAAGLAAQAEASTLLAQAQAMACRQGALSWELRIAMSRVRLSRRWGELEPAPELGRLAAVYDRFTEGFETRDLGLARELLGWP